jgi:anaphase-promoting complex subunit 6
MAQRMFAKATRIDGRCTEGWVAYGNSFALADESDQALSSYRAAQRLAPCSHVPLLYVGIEYIRTNNR